MISPIDTSGTNIIDLPVTPRAPLDAPQQPFLVEAPQPCIHFQGPFSIDMDAGKCFCKRCGGEVTPMFVLKQLMQQESRWLRHRREYVEDMQRLEQRSRTKCDHCGTMTKIRLR